MRNRKNLLLSSFYLARQIGWLYRAVEFPVFCRYLRSLIVNFRTVLRTKSLGQIDSKIQGAVRFTTQNTVVTVPHGYFSGARELYVRHVYFPNEHFHLRNSDVVIDLGANVGLFTTLASKICRRVIAVEALPEYPPKIRALLTDNKCSDNTTLIWGVVASSKGVLSNADLSQQGQYPIEVDVGELIASLSIDRVGFLKCDIEGSEFALFNSNSLWLRKVDRIAMEVHSEFGDPWSLVPILESHGFIISVTNDRGVAFERNQFEGESGYLFAYQKFSL